TVGRALAFDPAARHPSARELLQDLESWQPGLSSQATPQSVDSSDMSKMALGRHSPADEGKARAMAVAAVQLAKQAGRLTEAKDLLEEALNKCPDLREQYEYQLRLWHRGIVM